jgi:NADPH-dependent 2,4-dienoyl-CoA reductase/sulfur reductase-like enzyme
MERIVVVGASLAGVRAAETFRRSGFTGGLTIVGRETHYPPYDRPPLSKEILKGEWEPERARLKVDKELKANLVLGTSAVRLDLAAHALELTDGDPLVFDGLLIATGATPRSLPSFDRPLAGVHVLRTMDESIALRDELTKRPRVVVIGAGWIGLEVAATCRERGLDVTVVEFLSWPVARSFGQETGEWLATMHRAQGVELRFETAVAGIVGDDHVTGVLLGDGETLAADLVVIAIGVAPETGWLEDSGLVLENGILLDETCRAIGAPDVVAAGDVARWHNPVFDLDMRVEHWANAVEQGAAAAETLLRGPAEAQPFRSVPYFWSHQYGTRIQYVGIAGEFARVIEGSIDENRFVSVFADGERLVGALCVNWPARMVRYKRVIDAGVSVASLENELP